MPKVLVNVHVLCLGPAQSLSLHRRLCHLDVYLIGANVDKSMDLRKNIAACDPPDG